MYGTALKWFTSYLSHRFQAIKIRRNFNYGIVDRVYCLRLRCRIWSTNSSATAFISTNVEICVISMCELLFGAPQGSVLGPLLFSLYTTPLVKIIGMHPDIKVHYYANDSELFIHMAHKNGALGLYHERS